MTKNIFYQYDFYTLEQRYAEYEFLELLDGISSLNISIEPFIIKVVDLIFVSINAGEEIKIADIVLPKIGDDLKKLKGNFLYDTYSATNQSFSEFVLNKFLHRLFEKDGYNNEFHIIQNYFHTWLEKKLALEIVNDSRFSSLKILKLLLEKTEMLHNFYNYLVENIPQSWIKNNKQDWLNVDTKPEDLLDSFRRFDKVYFDSYMYSLKTKPKENLWEFVQEAIRESDYLMLNSEFHFISSVILKNDNIIWIEFWDNLKLPIIQDSALHFFEPKTYLHIMTELVSEKVKLKSDLKILLLIVAQNYFESSNKLTERLAFYEETERMNDDNKHLFQEGQKYYKEWLDERKSNYDSLIKVLQKKLSHADIEDWVFSYKPKENNKHYKPNEIYNSEIIILTEAYKENNILPLNFNLQNFNLQKFNFYVDIIREKDNKQLSNNLLETMINFIASDKFHWDKSYSEPYRSALKGVGLLLSQQDKTIQKTKDIINKFKNNHQGWKPIKIDYALLVKESFIYSGVIFLFEYHDSIFKEDFEKEQFYKELLDGILLQDRYSQSDNSEYYQLPLHLLFFVANQIVPNVKEYFEKELIVNYDNLYSLLYIFSSDDICDNSKSLLSARLNKEFLIEKRKYSNRSQKNETSAMEKMVHSLGFYN